MLTAILALSRVESGHGSAAKCGSDRVQKIDPRHSRNVRPFVNSTPGLSLSHLQHYMADRHVTAMRYRVTFYTRKGTQALGTEQLSTQTVFFILTLLCDLLTESIAKYRFANIFSYKTKLIQESRSSLSVSKPQSSVRMKSRQP